MSQKRDPQQRLPATRDAFSVALELAARLEAEKVPPRSRIGNLRDLAQRLSVPFSRARQAVALLEGAGILRQRVGAGGGVFFDPAEDEAIARVLRLSMAAGRLDVETVAGALAEVEALCAALAAQSAAGDEGRRLEEVARSDAFHDVLAASTGNAALVLIRGALDRALEARLEADEGDRGRLARDPDDVVYSHAHIVDAVRMGNPKEAAERARAHRMPRR